ncbi:hypothetical protein CXF72_11455 [Psychromonas sp. MB-3u-54]|uniref:pilus assembly PilX family protein n=1 Tax=Psychromonas sp. MB-3u-54 TaxID=2058319 RepID=UPI000C32EC0D|nr:hypothetical protein [Psychromonas sp. MB-3u-54]PKH02472.1 hypothetical protein CXF72_11455 [Psychromonas sp. MB-3u-54]
MNSINQYKGFVVLTTTVLLSIASIAFTAQMASTQLLDNKIVANDYRNNQAFVNAESGLNLLLSRLDDPILGPDIFNSATYNVSTTYTDSSTDNHYSVQLTWLNTNTLKLVSTGTSMDDSAQRIISLQIKPVMGFNLPAAAASLNGRLNLDAVAMVNNGCEGVSAADCESPGNFADYQLVSKSTVAPTDLCPGPVNDDNFYEPINSDNSLEIGSVDEQGDVIQWPNNIATGSNFYGTAAAGGSAASSLFESTFGVSKNAGITALKNSADVAKIDMTDGTLSTSCSERLDALALNHPDIDTIYITGNCDIDPNDAGQSSTSGNRHFTLGTVENPKMVFIEGGTFLLQHENGVPKKGAAVIGMLYFLSSDHNVVDLGGVRVNGALLSEYSCSYDVTPNVDNEQPFSVRYDKTVLNTLYGNIGRNRAIYNGYSIVQGSWRDF